MNEPKLSYLLVKHAVDRTIATNIVRHSPQFLPSSGSFSARTTVNLAKIELASSTSGIMGLIWSISASALNASPLFSRQSQKRLYGKRQY